ncbi:hypothetical protein, partial [Bradyrhizobium ottawaense]|uniref:hypothetical protein n=1 Tax=Bradyrhizobium ottawaense TaxID=931866 RepID=UPI0030C77206
SLLKRKKERPLRPTIGPLPLRTPDQSSSHRDAKRAEPSAPPGLMPPHRDSIFVLAANELPQILRKDFYYSRQ